MGQFAPFQTFRAPPFSWLLKLKIHERHRAAGEADQLQAEREHGDG